MYLTLCASLRDTKVHTHRGAQSTRHAHGHGALRRGALSQTGDRGTPRETVKETQRPHRLEASGYKITVHDALRLRVERHGKTQREIWKHCARLKVHF